MEFPGLRHPLRLLRVSVRMGIGLLLIPAIAPAHGGSGEPLKVVASFSVLGDMTRSLGGSRVMVHVLVGPDADAHVYEPVPADARRVAGAGLLILNGLEFEGWMKRLLDASGYRGPMVDAVLGIDTLRSPSGQGGDPHAWQSPLQARAYVRNIAAGLAKADPGGAEEYLRAEQAYLATLDSLDRWMHRRLASIPMEKRLAITSHDAFGYLARDYGIRFHAPLGWSTDEQASARKVATLIRQIRASRVRAVFVENIADPRLMRRIAKESGCTIGGRLYSDALSGPDGPAAGYPAMIRHNLAALTAAMAEDGAPIRTAP